MSRRFAGERMGSATAVPSDTLAAATEALKAAQASLKGSRGGRLGQGSQLEREEATASKAAGSETVLPTAAASPTAAMPAGPTDVASLRKALGIDDLLTSLRGMGTSSAPEMPKFEMPTFEMPEFEVPKFEAPDFKSMFEDAFAKYAPPTTSDTTAATQQTTATTTPAPATKTNKVTVGSKSYDLAKYGGSGLGSRDVKALQSKGWTKSEIKQVAAQAPHVSTGAQKVVGKTPSQKAQATAKTLTSNAKTAVAKAASKGGNKKK